MVTRAELKRRGKEAFRRNYWAAVAVTVVAGILNVNYQKIVKQIDTDMTAGHLSSVVADISVTELTGILLIMLLMAVLKLILGNLLELGGCRFFLENRNAEPGAGTVFYFFKKGRYANGFVTLLVRNIYIYLWTLLFIVPGIIKQYEYAMIPYLLAENPGMARDRAFDLSREMMHGHKWELFVLYLSFIWWWLLAIVTCGLGAIFYVGPYIRATVAEFYAERRREAFEKGISGPDELYGFEEEKSYMVF